MLYAFQVAEGSALRDAARGDRDGRAPHLDLLHPYGNSSTSDSVAESERGKGRCRVGHELPRVTAGVTFLIDRNASPRAQRRLVAFKPLQAFGNLRIVFWHAGNLENMQDNAGRVPVA